MSKILGTMLILLIIIIILKYKRLKSLKKVFV